MRAPTPGKSILAGALLVAIIAGVAVTPGERHEHEHGDVPHSHGGSPGSGEHSHAGHSHAGDLHDHPHRHSETGHHHHHGHSHHHHEHAHAHVHGDAEHDEEAEKPAGVRAGRSRAHWHVTLFGFEFTLPVLDAGGLTRRADGAPALPVDLAQVVQQILRIVSPLPPERVRLTDAEPTGQLARSARVACSSERDEPAVPPPRLV